MAELGKDIEHTPVEVIEATIEKEAYYTKEAEGFGIKRAIQDVNLMP